MKKIFKKISLTLTLLIGISTIPAYASTNKGNVIAVIDGVDIMESDIDENGLITKDISSEISDIHISKSSGNKYVRKGQNAFMIKHLKAPRFSQQTDSYFLNPSDAKDYAYSLTSSSNLSIVANSIMGIVIGYTIKTSHVGTIFTAVSMLTGLKMNSIQNSILNLARNGNSVEVRIIKTTERPAPIYYVNTWNGTTINPNLINNSVTKESIHFYKAK